MNLVVKSRCLAVALFALMGGVGMMKAEEAKANAASAAKEKAKSVSSATSIQKLIEQLGAQRDAMIADHEALLKQYKEATEAQKRELLRKMESQRKAFEEVTSALQRQIADERRKQRAGAVPPKR